MTITKWELQHTDGAEQKLYYEAPIALQPGDSEVVNVDDVCVDLDMTTFFSVCPVNSNPYFRTATPPGRSTYCLIPKAAFEARHQPYGPTECDPLKQKPLNGKPGDQCFCPLGDTSDYAGTFQ